MSDSPNSLDNVLNEYLTQIESADDKPAALRLLLSTPMTEELEDELQRAQVDLDAETLSCAISILRGTVDFLQLQNLSEDEFYEQLCEQISGNPVFCSIEMKQSALFYLFYSPCMPYHQIQNMISMEQSEFTRRQGDLEKEIMDLYVISNRRFAQRTHEASAILGLIDSQEDERDRVVLLTMLLLLLRQELEGE